MKGYRKPRKKSAKTPRKECISLLEREDSDTSTEYPRKRKNNKEKVYIPTVDLPLCSLKEALALIKTYKSSKSNTKQILEESCQLAADKHVIEESSQFTTLYIEHNTLTYMKEIFLQSILKADFFTGVQVLCSMLETENISLLLYTIYFKKAALMIYMYNENISQLQEFLKYAVLAKRNNPSEEGCFKLLKKYLKLKPRKELPV